MSSRGSAIRRLAPVVLLVLASLLVAASPSPVPRPADACRDVAADPPQACTVVRALTDGVAAACRRAGGDPACAVVDGRDVSESAVAAAERGDLAEVLAIQRRLQADVPLRSALFAATHNSYNSLAYDPTLSRLDGNQTLSMRDQLRLGIRRLELDVHLWFAPDGSRVPVTCHATDEPNVLGDPVTRHTGCTTEDHVEVGLAEIAGWLADHPDEVVMLRFETHLEGAEGHDALARAVEDTIGDRLFRPAGPGCTELPLDLTTAEVRAAGAQVIAVGGCGQGSLAWPQAAFDDDDVRRESTYRGEPHAFPDCGGIDRQTREAHWIRWFEDATVVSSVTAAGGDAPAPVTADVVREWVRCGVNQPSFDHVVPGDDRLAALAWSFEPGTQDAPDGSCAEVTSDGGLHAVPCAGERRPWTCLGKDGIAVTEARGPWQGGDDACRAEGLGRFATPRTGEEAARLAGAAAGDAPWASVRRVDATWRLGCVVGGAGATPVPGSPPITCP